MGQLPQTGRWHVIELNREKGFMYLIPTSWDRNFLILVVLLFITLLELLPGTLNDIVSYSEGLRQDHL